MSKIPLRLSIDIGLKKEMIAYCQLHRLTMEQFAEDAFKDKLQDAFDKEKIREIVLDRIEDADLPTNGVWKYIDKEV